MVEVGSLMAARPAALRSLDREREADPRWFCEPGMLGYSAYVDRFGNPENVLRLAGVLMLCAAAAVLMVRYDAVAAKADGGALPGEDAA